MDRFHLLPARHVLPRLLTAPLSALILLAAFVGSPPRSASAAASHPASSCSMQSVTAFSTPDNPDHGWGVDLSFSVTDFNPNAFVFVTHNALGNDAGISTPDPHPLGVWYDWLDGQWAIWNEDDSPMPNGAAFNVLAMDGPSCSDRAFVHTATAANSSYDYTDIASPLTDNQPLANLLVTHNFSPGGTYSYIRDPHPLGVWYHDGHWAIFHQDLTPIPVGASYNVLVVNNTVGHCSSLCSADFHQAGYNNTFDNETLIDDPRANYHPHALVYVTANFNNPGAPFPFPPDPGIYVNANLGVIYETRQGTTGQWAIFTEDGSAMPIGASFNVLVISAT